MVDISSPHGAAYRPDECGQKIGGSAMIRDEGGSRPLQFLSVGGEMGALMRAHDWTRSPLGPPAQWPDALKMAVSICLNSRFPMVLWWGPEFIMLYNDAWRPILGAAKHPQGLGRPGIETFPEIWDIIGEQLGSVLKRGEATWSEDLLLAVDRSGYLEEAYFTYSYSPIKAADGRVGGVFTAVSETTERVLSERRMQILRELAARSAESKSVREACLIFAEVLGETNPDIPFALLYLVDGDGRGVSLAASAGLQRSNYHPAGHLALDGNDGWSIARAVRHGEPVVLDDLHLRVAALPAGIWPEPTTQAIVFPVAKSGQHAGVTGVLIAGINPRRALDIPYRRFFDLVAAQMATAVANSRAYEEERRRSEALAEIDRAKTTFFSNVSHEFRTPLTLILGPLDEVLPEAGERLGPERHEQLLTVRRNALRLLKLVNTLLDFSRIEAGRVQAVYQPTDLASVTAEIASVFRSAMENAGLRFSVECQPSAEPVYVDRDMWEKVVLNLLSNAFKFTFGGEVAVTLTSVDGAVELQVRDTGVGIPEENRERVFERFHRIEGTHARTYEGTGIGLALVQELVKLHGGSVRVESALGKGSTFTVTIPSGSAHLPAGRIQAAQLFASTKIRAEAYVEEAQQWLGDESGAAIDVAMLPRSPLVTSLPEPKPAERRELIILADDNADMRQYLSHQLGDRYEVHAVADGRQALEVTRQLRPALVLADVMMPQLDGFGLLRAIRDDSALASTPVLLLSARAGEESRVEGLQAGADDYLVKPFAARELLARVEAHIKLANLRRETVEREERLRSEAELERQKLRASEERLVETSRLYHELQNREAKIRRLVDANIIGIFIWNLDGQIVEANDAFLRMVGYDREDVASCSLRWTDLTPTEWRERDERAVAEVTRTGSAHPFEKEYFRKDGSRVPVLIGGALFEASRNEGVAFVLDLTERKRAEEALRELESKFHPHESREHYGRIGGLAVARNRATDRQRTQQRPGGPKFSEDAVAGTGRRQGSTFLCRQRC
jgi:PAS domain S-box-containing protein